MADSSYERTPTIIESYMMPDACPSGPHGTITVGGVARARGAIHPGMHSADICCSMMVTSFPTADPKDVLDAIHEVTHFGYGGRKDGRFGLPRHLLEGMSANSFLSDPAILDAALTWATTRSALTVFLLPAYSALHVAALAMALADLVRCPSAWNKTAHGVAARPTQQALASIRQHG